MHRLHFRGLAGPLVLQMRAYGAMVVKSTTPVRSLVGCSRWGARVRLVSDSPFFSPVVGSNPYGMKVTRRSPTDRRAFDWNRPTGACCRSAMATPVRHVEGLEDLLALGWIDRVPRFVAAEVSGSLTPPWRAAMPCRPRCRATRPRSRPRSARAGHGAGPSTCCAVRRCGRDDRDEISGVGRGARGQEGICRAASSVRPSPPSSACALMARSRRMNVASPC